VTISRRRLAATILGDLPYGGNRRLAERLGIAEGRVSRALHRPDEFANDFCLIADLHGWEPAQTLGFYREKEMVAA